MLDLTRLRLLRELAHRGTMTAVAEALGLTSSAVSQQLATLEREAGVALLDRVGRRVQFTAAGTRLAAHAESILLGVEAAELDLRATGDQPQGELEIATFSTFAKVHLLAAVVRAKKLFPRMQVVIRELESTDAIEAVRGGRCHLAMGFSYNLVPRADTAGLTAKLLLEEPVFLAVPSTLRARRGPIPLANLAQEDWIVGSRQSDDRLLAERACAVEGFAPRITHTVDDYDLLLRMVSADLGVGFVPELGLRFPSAKSVQIRKPGGTPLSRRIYALTRGALTASPLVRALLSELADAVKSGRS